MMMRHGLLNPVNKHTKHQCVDSSSQRLVEHRLDKGIALVELGLDEAAPRGLVVELGVGGIGVGGGLGGRGDGFGGG